MSGRERLVVGCMTGTSIDALDAAAVEISGEGLGMSARIVGAVSRALGGVGAGLRRLAEQEAMTAGEVAALSRAFGLLHADVIKDLLAAGAAAGIHGGRADLVAAHGQTVFHAPPVSWQLLNGAVIAREVGTRVVYDLRAADLAAGGQGAPITPVADWVLLRRVGKSVAVANLGGFCNVTVLPPSAGREPGCAGAWEDETGRIAGFDVCACNQLLDAASAPGARRSVRRGREVGRRRARGRERGGEPRAPARSAGRAGRSLGTGDELAGWVEQHAGRLAPEDVLRSCVQALATVVARAGAGADALMLAGGGTRNTTLVECIRKSATVPVLLTDEVGVPAEYREAVAMAVLGALCEDRVPITLAGVTEVAGAVPVAGVWALP